MSEVKSIDVEENQFAYRYDTQLLIDKRDKDLDEDEIADYITNNIEGNCLIAVGDEDMIKIHFHTAHMTEYAVLAILVMIALIVDGIKGIKLPIISAVIATAFAATDEFHQVFVPGRYGCVRDVLIDAAGSVIGLAIAYVIYINVCKRKYNK